MKIRKLSLALLAFAFALAPLAGQASEADKKKAVDMVNSAVDFYKANGKDKAFAAISNPKSQFHDGDLYVFVYDMEGNVVAHGQKANMIGKNMLHSTDVPGGKRFVEERIQIAKDKGEGWQNYKFQNPRDHKIEDKVSYLKKADNYIFGVGIYGN